MRGMDVSEGESSESYFTSYEDLEIHRLMLDDKPRTEAYRSAIKQQAHLFKDKVVMDVGAGTGILSVFCAQAGAKKVYAVEASGLAKLIPRVVEENKLSHVIEVIHKRVEDVVLPADEKVDIIISEWMGFYLLHEAMLDSVIVARDHHLKSDGIMFPEAASLWASACSLPSLLDYWEDVCGVKMRAFGIAERSMHASVPKIIEIKSEDILTEPNLVCTLNLRTLAVTDLDQICKRVLVPAVRDGKYQGISIWFTCMFPVGDKDSEPIVLSTAPMAPLTHWKQTAIVLQEDLEVEEGYPLSWELNLKRNAANSRHYDLQLEMLDPEKEKHPMPCGCHMTKCIVIRAFIAQADEEPDVSDEEDMSEDDKSKDEQEVKE